MHDALRVAVVMRRERLHGPSSHWQPWRWTLEAVVPDLAGGDATVQRLSQDADATRWLHPGFGVELFRDETEGYRLNLDTPAPGWFVQWRLDETPAPGDDALARPTLVTLSYNEAGRWLDAQEQVEQVPAPPEIVAWLSAFVREHHVDEPRRRQRPQSFRPLVDRFGQPASVSTGKHRGGGEGGGGGGGRDG